MGKLGEAQCKVSLDFPALVSRHVDYYRQHLVLVSLHVEDLHKAAERVDRDDAHPVTLIGKYLLEQIEELLDQLLLLQRLCHDADALC